MGNNLSLIKEKASTCSLNESFQKELRSQAPNVGLFIKILASQSFNQYSSLQNLHLLQICDSTVAQSVHDRIPKFRAAMFIMTVWVDI